MAEVSGIEWTVADVLADGRRIEAEARRLFGESEGDMLGNVLDRIERAQSAQQPIYQAVSIDPDMGGWYDIPEQAYRLAISEGRKTRVLYATPQPAKASGSAPDGCGACGNGCNGGPCRVLQDSPPASTPQPGPRLYNAINRLMLRIGHDGDISSKAQECADVMAALAALPSDIAKPDAPQPFTDDEPFDGGSLTLGAIERERNKRFEELITLADDDENHAAGLVLVAELVGLDLPCSMEDIAREIRLLKSRRIPASRAPRGGRGVDD